MLDSGKELLVNFSPRVALFAIGLWEMEMQSISSWIAWFQNRNQQEKPKPLMLFQELWWFKTQSKSTGTLDQSKILLPFWFKTRHWILKQFEQNQQFWSDNCTFSWRIQGLCFSFSHRHLMEAKQWLETALVPFSRLADTTYDFILTQRSRKSSPMREFKANLWEDPLFYLKRTTDFESTIYYNHKIITHACWFSSTTLGKSWNRARI